MLYNLLAPYANDVQFFNLFRYITFRSGGAVFTALILALVMGPRVIRWLKSKQGEGQPIRTDGPESHLLTKKGTPTMGGIMILLSWGIATLVWADLSYKYVWVVVLATLGFGAVGAVDDFLKLTKRNSRGLSSRRKIMVQIVISLLAAIVIQEHAPTALSHHIAIPFLKSVLIDAGAFYLFFVLIVMIGASNAVNLTDGLDGLVSGPVVIAAGCFALISYLVGNAVFSGYLQLHFVPGAGELAILCSALIGATLGFLWFNAPPARVFMGDTGSLAIGGMLGAVAVITKHEFVLAIIGGLFVIEALSVMIQVISFKTRGKRVFRMAPIHHHYEKLGWQEATIVIRFWIVAVIFALLGLATLKLR